MRKLIIFCLFFILCMVFVTRETMSIIDKSDRVKLKKEFSSYSEALLLTVTQLGENTKCYHSSVSGPNNELRGCHDFFHALVNNLNKTKHCYGKALEHGCVPIYQKYTDDPKCVGFSEKMINNYAPVFILNDRSSLIVYKTLDGLIHPIFAVDVNGKMEPNKPGYDLFSFVIIKNENNDFYLHPHITFCLPPEKGGINNIHDLD
ncbi:MAG: hypothetical protein LBJ74_04465 [Heliobacteriaceae bacterium]|jgi:hypothetical protein|nr:hypothetical protein [Heliobacteriaceae bacterium]